MKTIIFFALLLISSLCSGQAIVGKWQLTEDKSCLESGIGKSDTELELESAMSGSRNSIAKIIIFKKDGTGEEGVFAVGKKKGSGMSPFKYKIVGTELHLMDKKSGIISQRFIIDELGSATLSVHNALRECEKKVFTKIN